MIVGGLGAARRGRGRELRGAALRRVLGDADGAGAPRVPRRRVPRAPVRPVPRREPRRDGDPALVHAAGRADRARRGVPRRRRRRAASTAPGPRSRVGHPRAGCRPRPGSPRRSASPPRSCSPSWPAISPSPTVSSWSSRAPSSTFLHPLPVRRLWGVGPGDRAPPRRRSASRPSATSPRSPRTRSCARSATPRVTTSTRSPGTATSGRSSPTQEVKSIGHEETFPTDLHDHAALEHELVAPGRRGGVAAAGRATPPAGPSSSRCASATSAPSPAPARWRRADRPRRRRRPGGPRPAPVARRRRRRAPARASRPSSSCAGTRAPSGRPSRARPRSARAGHEPGGRTGHADPDRGPTRPEAPRRLAEGAPGRARAFGGRGPGPVRSWCRRVRTGE